MTNLSGTVSPFLFEDSPRSVSVQAPYSELYWLISETILICVTAVTVYLLVSMAKFGFKTGCKPGSELRGKKGKILFQTCLVSVAMAVGRLLSDQAVALIGWQTDIGCRVTVSVSIVFYSLSLYPVYIFLWLRQSIFYASPVLSNVLSPIVTITSWVVLVCMLTGGAILTVLFNVPQVTGWNYAASPTGCRDISDDSGFELIPTILVCFITTMQIGLLFLFIYPLISKKTLKYRETRKMNGASNVTSTGSDINPENSSNLFSNEQEEPSIQGASDANLTNDDLMEDKRKSMESHYQPGVIYRKQRNEETSGKKKTVHKNKTYSITSQVKRGISWSVTSAGSYKSSKKRRGSKTQQGRRVIRFIRKAFFLALVCVISDIIFTVLQLVIVVPELVYLVLYDINLLINIVCIILSFRNWPKMLLPFCCRQIQQHKKLRKMKKLTVSPVDRDVRLPASLQHKASISPVHVVKRNGGTNSLSKISPTKFPVGASIQN